MDEKFDITPTQAVGKQRDVIYVQPLSKQELLDRLRTRRANPAVEAVSIAYSILDEVRELAEGEADCRLSGKALTQRNYNRVVEMALAELGDLLTHRYREADHWAPFIASRDAEEVPS